MNSTHKSLSFYTSLVGIIIGTIYLVYSIYISVMIQIGPFFSAEFFNELGINFSVAAFLLIPGIIIFLRRPFPRVFEYISLLYPFLILASFLLVFFIAQDPLEAGLPMILIVFPTLIIIAIVYGLIPRKKG